MPEVVAVRLRYNPKNLWFNPSNTQPAEGDHVIVETERGTEIGLVTAPIMEVSQREISALPSPIKRIIRIADERDLDKADDLDRKAAEAMPVFRELVEKYELEMKPVNVEYLFGGEKMVFYFASDGRIDFRELVRELASMFHTRVDMRQIGVRDEARMIGGIAHCGEVLCCARLSGEFQPVSIRMAKEQDLPLNPLKISGLCGRLMCCLRYEFEAYKDFKSRAPKKGALIETPLGLAKVVDFDTPKEQITMRLEDGKSVTVPLARMECDGCGDEAGKRPCRVSREVMDECANSNVALALTSLDRLDEEKNDDDMQGVRPKGQQGGKRRARHIPALQKENETDDQAAAQKKPTPRRRRRKSATSASKLGEGTESVASKQQPKKDAIDARTSQGVRAGNAQKKKGAGQGAKQPNAQGPKPRKAKAQTAPSKPRPGQKSSGIRGAVQSSSRSAQESRPTSEGHRKPRRRHGGGDAKPEAKNN